MLSLLCTILLLLSANIAIATSEKKPLKPCTIVSPTSERFFDLNPLQKIPLTEDTKEKKDAEDGSWRAKGYDYGANFTLNFCGPVVEKLDSVQDLDKDLWKNVSAYYEKGNRQYAIGNRNGTSIQIQSTSYRRTHADKVFYRSLLNTVPIFRGHKLIMNYTGGSLCPPSSKHSRSLEPASLHDRRRESKHDGDDDNNPSKDKDDKSVRRKTTIISLLCDSDPLAKASVSFVAAVDDCTYIFEGRSPSACGGVHQDSQALGPGGVFGVIAMIAILVYLVGGYFYQRTVMHQRGWRQLPNYSMWAGIWRFFVDVFVILTSSCARFLPSRRGYSRVSLGYDNNGRGRRNEDENRLIDNLDEEWDD